MLLDPYPLWLDAVEQVMERVGVRVQARTTSPREALAAIERDRPDLFLTEVDTLDPALDGIECMRRARVAVPALKTVVLSARQDHGSIDAALDAGAIAYVIKTAHPDQVASAIRQAFDTSVFLAGSRPRPAAPQPTASAASEDDGVRLTRRELELLKLVAEGHSNAHVARMLWVTEQTVKFHLSNVYRKLGVANRTEASRWAQTRGLLSVEPPRG